MPFLETNSLVCKEQFGFRKELSTTHAMARQSTALRRQVTIYVPLLAPSNTMYKYTTLSSLVELVAGG